MKIEPSGVVLLGPPMHIVERPKRGCINVAYTRLALADQTIGLLNSPALPGCNSRAREIIEILGVVIRAADKPAGVQYVVDVAGNRARARPGIVVAADQLDRGITLVLGRK